MEAGIVFLAILLVGGFLFTIIGVICLIVKASAHSDRLTQNSQAISWLQKEQEKLHAQIKALSQRLGEKIKTSEFTEEGKAEETAPKYTPDYTAQQEPEKSPGQSPGQPPIFTADSAQSGSSPLEQVWPQAPGQVSAPQPVQGPQSTELPDFTKPEAYAFNLPPDFESSSYGNLFAGLNQSPRFIGQQPTYGHESGDQAPDAMAGQAAGPTPAWARSGLIKPVPLNTLKLDFAKAQKEATAREAASLWNQLRSFISGGHLWVAGGVLLLFIAFALLLTYMASRGLFTVEMRIASAALSGIAMLLLGWRIRESKPTYSLVLQGGGIGLLYMSIFASAKLTTLISPVAALILISLLIPPTIILALKQRSQPLAMFGLLGGFAAPILLSTDSGNYIALFTYYCVLNSAVLIIGHFRLWRGLNLLAFICTFGVALTWVLSRYQPEMFATAEPFMLIFMAMFTFLGIQSAKRREISLKNFVDLPLTLGTPFVCAVIQWRIFSHIDHGLPIISLAFSAAYLLLTFIIWKRRGVSMRSLAEGYLALSVLLANLAIPLEMSASATSAVWAAEGILLYYFGVRLGSKRIKAAGLLFHAAAAVAFALRDSSIHHYSSYYEDASLFRHSNFTGCLIIALSAIVTAVFAHSWERKKVLALDEPANEKTDPPLSKDKIADELKSVFKASILVKILIAWGFVWWFSGWWLEFNRVFDYPSEGFFILLSASALVAFGCARFFRCQPLAWATVAPLVFAFLFVSHALLWRTISLMPYDPLNVLTFNFFEEKYIWGWLLFFASQTALLYFMAPGTDKAANCATNSPCLKAPARLHAAWLFLALLITATVLTCTGRAYTQIWNLSESWTSLAGILPALIFVSILPMAAKSRSDLPSPHRWVMLLLLPAILCTGTTIWFLGTLFAAGTPDPLPMYIPLLNPLDLQQAFCIAVLAMWQIQAQKAGNMPALSKHALVATLDVMVFLWLTAMLARASHYILDIPMSAVPHSGKFHLALLVLWGLYGITHIIVGHKMPMRRVWVAGALLTVIDIAKLLLVDLAHTGTITRIISFFIAGLLLLFIGWVAPLPPASQTKAKQA